MSIEFWVIWVGVVALVAIALVQGIKLRRDLKRDIEQKPPRGRRKA